MHNTIVLTSGLTGSSVLTGLLTRAGYWPGERTVKKKDYDTFENGELVRLNLDLFQRSGLHANYLNHFSAEAIECVTALAGTIDVEPYRAFFRECQAHRFWVWKDPRLWMTIRFWREIVDLSDCNFLLLTRDHFQVWVSANNRRVIQSYRHTKAYESAVQDSIEGFLEENRFSYQKLSYDNLLGKPELTIGRLNRFLRTNLTVADLAAVYHGPINRAPNSSLAAIVKSTLIYLKNYHQRADSIGVPSGPPLSVKTLAPPPAPHSPST